MWRQDECSEHSTLSVRDEMTGNETTIKKPSNKRNIHDRKLCDS